MSATAGLGSVTQGLSGYGACPGSLPKGFNASVQIGILPYAGVDIMTFELMKEYLLERYDGMPPPYAILGAGMLSSSIAQFASYPLALVRTRMQVSSDSCQAIVARSRGVRSSLPL